MKKFQLKGCLWKPGVNGLGIRGFHHLPYRKRFDGAARMHDKLYDCEGTSKDRFKADRLFFFFCIDSCNTDLQCFFAILYFVIVRMFGWAFYRYDKQIRL